MSECGSSALVCRTCLHIGDETRSLHSTLQLAGSAVRLSDILSAFFNYQVDENDGLPQDICLVCVYQLTATYTFDIIIRDSSSKLAKAEVQPESHDDQTNDQADFDSNDEVKPLIEPIKTDPDPTFIRRQKNRFSASKKLHCVDCKEIFMTSTTLLEHCHARHPPKNTAGRLCDYCNERFCSFQSLIRHRMFHLSRHVCELCWNGFDNTDDLNFHKCEITSTERPITDPRKVVRQCDQCGKSYPQGYIKIHMRIHSNNRPYRCKYCPKRFKVPCSLNSHVLWNHEKSRTHKCDMCDAMFVTASARSAHKRKHHLLEKKHTCETCAKKFFSKSEMQRHILTHTGVKNFLCNHCDKSYQTRYGLNVHLKSHSNAVST